MDKHKHKDDGLSRGAQALADAFRAFSFWRKPPGGPPAGEEHRHGEFRLMRCLALAEERGVPGLKVSELADELGVKPPTVTAMVDALLKRGLVTRGSDSADRRVVLVSFSDKGRELSQAMRKRMHAEMIALTEHLGEKESIHLAKTLMKAASFLMERHGNLHCQHGGKEDECSGS